MTFHSLAASQPLALCCPRSGGTACPRGSLGQAGLELAGHGGADRQRAERAGSAPWGDGRDFSYTVLKPGVPKSFVDKTEEWISFSLVHKLQ